MLGESVVVPAGQDRVQFIEFQLDDPSLKQKLLRLMRLVIRLIRYDFKNVLKILYHNIELILLNKFQRNFLKSLGASRIILGRL